LRRTNGASFAPRFQGALCAFSPWFPSLSKPTVAQQFRKNLLRCPLEHLLLRQGFLTFRFMAAPPKPVTAATVEATKAVTTRAHNSDMGISECALAIAYYRSEEAQTSSAVEFA
jgi:hypothetical protein